VFSELGGAFGKVMYKLWKLNRLLDSGGVSQTCWQTLGDAMGCCAGRKSADMAAVGPLHPATTGDDIVLWVRNSEHRRG
jgi:hypothetical protein